MGGAKKADPLGIARGACRLGLKAGPAAADARGRAGSARADLRQAERTAILAKRSLAASPFAGMGPSELRRSEMVQSADAPTKVERVGTDAAFRQRPADPFTLDVIQQGLAAAADEMFAILKKTAMSPIIYEVLDVGTGITDGQGNLVSSGAGIPGFVGALDKAIKRLLQIVPFSEIAAGDIFVTNDPYYGGVTHLNDVVLAMPVFVAGELVAWAANIGHWNDVGGAVPGSMSVDARDIHAEGLRLPGVKLFEAGKPLESVMKIIAANSRLPDFLLGDLWAGVASVRKGAERIERLATTHGPQTFAEALVDYYDYAERQARDGLARLPKGRLRLEEP